MIDHSGLLTLLSYNPLTGDFHWRPGQALGKASYTHTAGWNGHYYRYLTIRQERYLAHRVAWFYVNETWPSADIDHINGDRWDNRIANLRCASTSQNIANGPGYTDHLKGTYLSRGKWNACIKSGGKTRWLGSFNSEESAHAAYMSAAREAFGEFANAGSIAKARGISV